MNPAETTQMLSSDPNRTIMGSAPTVNATITIKPVQCPVCKTFNPMGVMFCVECGLIFDRALEGDAFGAPAIQLPVLIDSAGREHPLRPGSNSIGRTGDVLVEDSRASRQHAQITLDGQTLTLQDLGSTNGTKLNDEKLPAHEDRVLKSGDKISLGGYEMTVSMPGESAKTAVCLSNRTEALTAAPTVDATVAYLVTDDRRDPLLPGANTIGRKPENSIAIPDPHVSGRHAEIQVSDGEFTLKDLGSTNGTFLNGARLAADQPMRITPEDEIRFGERVVKLELA